jgi:hypothetical protein
MIRGIRAAQPYLSAAAVEALLRIASGADSAPELHRQMGMSISQAERLVLILCGRGTTGIKARRSNLRLIERTRHPHKSGFRLALTQNGRDLIASTFAPSTL